MSLTELNQKTCDSVGTVSSWDTLLEVGNAVKTHRKFVGCKGK